MYRKHNKVIIIQRGKKRTLEALLKEHQSYLDGKSKKKVNFKGADLHDVDLSGLDLSGINFEGANLSGSNLSNCNLSNANMNDTDCSNVDFSYSNMTNTDTCNMKLIGCCITGIKRQRWTSKKKYYC